MLQSRFYYNVKCILVELRNIGRDPPLSGKCRNEDVRNLRAIRAKCVSGRDVVTRFPRPCLGNFRTSKFVRQCLTNPVPDVTGLLRGEWRDRGGFMAGLYRQETPGPEGIEGIIKGSRKGLKDLFQLSKDPCTFSWVPPSGGTVCKVSLPLYPRRNNFPRARFPPLYCPFNKTMNPGVIRYASDMRHV